MDLNGGPFSNLPIYDQGTEGLCYSYAASQLIDAWRVEHHQFEEKRLSSPIHAGAIYTINGKRQNAILKIEAQIQERLNDSSRDAKSRELSIKSLRGRQKDIDRFLDPTGGSTIGVLEDLRNRKSVCSTDELFGPDAQQNYKQKIEPIAKLRRYALHFSEKRKTLACDLTETFNSEFAGQVLDVAKAVDDILKHLDSDNEFLESLLSNFCKTPIDLTALPAPKQYVATPYKAVSELSKTPPSSALSTANELMNLLSQNPPQPISLSYCSRFLITSDRMSRYSSCDAHASVVVGRSFREGKCQILIRNSWGESCTWEDQQPRYVYPCENGQIWVPLEEVSRRVTTIDWLK